MIALRKDDSNQTPLPRADSGDAVAKTRHKHRCAYACARWVFAGTSELLANAFARTAKYNFVQARSFFAGYLEDRSLTNILAMSLFRGRKSYNLFIQTRKYGQEQKATSRFFRNLGNNIIPYASSLTSGELRKAAEKDAQK